MRCIYRMIFTRDTSVIDTAIAIKVSTLIETQEAPFLQLHLPSTRGKSFTIERINAILGKIPVVMEDGISYQRSIISSCGTPLNMIYSNIQYSIR